MATRLSRIGQWQWRRRIIRAATLREKGWLTDAEYGAIACDAIYRLSVQKAHRGPHIFGLVVDGSTLWLKRPHALGVVPVKREPTHADDESIASRTQRYGPLLSAALFVRNTSDADQRIVSASGGFTWEEKHEELLEQASRKAARIHFIEQWLSRQKRRYPHTMSVVGTVLAALLSGAIGFYFGWLGGKHQ